MCPGCGAAAMPWITTCSVCERPIAAGPDGALADQLAAPSPDGPPTWIDIAVSCDEPAKVALLRHFLTEHGFQHEESKRFVSVRGADAERLLLAIDIWAFDQDLPDDERHLDSLAATLREIGHAVLNAVQSAIPDVGADVARVATDARQVAASRPQTAAAGIDLR